MKTNGNLRGPKLFLFLVLALQVLLTVGESKRKSSFGDFFMNALSLGGSISQEECLEIRDANLIYTSQMRRFFEEMPFPDIIFKVQGEDIPAHKGFLAVKSSYFNQTFRSIVVIFLYL